ncbi:MAG: hypothetical protein LBT16_12595 [Treponema sp.]|jgi:hypothetical protein|nr:hypothetical protein [Treponema sp.]
MAHGLIKVTIIPEIVHLIEGKYSVKKDKAMEMFYKSSTAASLADDETGLYGQSALYIFSLFNEEFEKTVQNTGESIKTFSTIQAELETLKNIPCKG